jgi:hypothetical protein
MARLVTMSQQDLIRLLADYRRRLKKDGTFNTAALLRALIAEIEEREPERPASSP